MSGFIFQDVVPQSPLTVGEGIYITAQAEHIGGRDVERLYASPKARTTVQHEVGRAVRYVQDGSRFGVARKKLAAFGSAQMQRAEAGRT